MDAPDFKDVALNKQEALAHCNQTNTAVIRNSWKEDGCRKRWKHTN